MYNNVHSFVHYNFGKLTASFFLKSFKFFFYVMLNLPVIITPLRTYLFDEAKF